MTMDRSILPRRPGEEHVRDDLFHDPAYNTKLFGILAILQKFNSGSVKALCTRCHNELSGIVVGTCREWLDNESNIDFPLNSRARIRSAIVDPATGDIMFTTALNAEPVAVNEAGFMRTAADPGWWGTAIKSFITHVRGREGDGQSAARRHEWQFKLWYLFAGDYREDHLFCGWGIPEFANNSMELLHVLSQKYPCHDRCWPYPSATYPSDQAVAQHTDELFDHIMYHMSFPDLEDMMGIDVGGIIKSALEDLNLQYWLGGELDQLAVMNEVSNLATVQYQMDGLRDKMVDYHQKQAEDWVVEWQVGITDRRHKRVPGVPTGDEEALKRYEVTRIANIIGPILEDINMGDLFGTA